MTSSILESMNVSPLAWSIPELQAFIATFDNNTKFLVGIRAKPSSTLVGFYTVSVNRRHRTAQFTAAIGDKACWGKGVLAETTRALVDHMFKTRGVEKMVARVVATNKRIILISPTPRCFSSRERFGRKSFHRMARGWTC